MPRAPRNDEPGAWHHVYSRGARRAPVFKVDAHCELLLDLVADMVDRLRLEVHGYALMPNHYHLLVRSPHGNLSKGIQRLNGRYTVQVNRLNQWDGPVFRGRFGSRRIANEDWLLQVLAYIHLNPVKAHLVSRPDELCWTSHRAYVGLEPTPEWLTTGVLGPLFGEACLDAYVRDLHLGRSEWPAALNTAEGWLNNAATNETRGQALSFYMIVQMLGIIAAQGILLLGDPSGFVLFVIPSVLISISFAPILLSITPTPAFEQSKNMGFRELWNVSPLGVVGLFILGGLFSAQFGMAAVFGTAVGMTVGQISTFVAAIYL